MAQVSTAEEIYTIIEDNDIEFVRLQFSDMTGAFREMEIGSDLLEYAFRKGLPFDSRLDAGSAGMDMIIRPDPRTFSIIPWKQEKGRTARLICEIQAPDGSPYEGCPRYTLKKAVRNAFRDGLTMQVTPSVSFFLYEIKDGKVVAETPDGNGLYAFQPAGRAEDVRRDIFRTLRNMDIEIESSNRGQASGQYEFVLKTSSCLRAADNIMTLKFVAGAIARIYGMQAVFMPKPAAGQPGSGMPLAVSLFRGEDNIFFRRDGDMMLSEEALSFIAGLLGHAAAMTPVTNPVINSYKRFVPGTADPYEISWSASETDTLVRIPARRGKNTQAELRSPDAACNPYLALSLILACGCDGIAKKANPGAPAEMRKANPSGQAQAGILPPTLSDALRAFRADPCVTEALGPVIPGNLIRKAEKEIAEFNACVHQWEIDKYIRSL